MMDSNTISTFISKRWKRSSSCYCGYFLKGTCITGRPFFGTPVRCFIVLRFPFKRGAGIIYSLVLPDTRRLITTRLLVADEEPFPAWGRRLCPLALPKSRSAVLGRRGRWRWADTICSFGPRRKPPGPEAQRLFCFSSSGLDACNDKAGRAARWTTHGCCKVDAGRRTEMRFVSFAYCPSTL
jgi:hypothetical protein